MTARDFIGPSTFFDQTTNDYFDGIIFALHSPRKQQNVDRPSEGAIGQTDRGSLCNGAGSLSRPRPCSAKTSIGIVALARSCVSR